MVYESLGLQKKNGFMWEGNITPYVTYEFSNNTSLRTEFSLRRFDFNNELRSELDIRRFIENGSKFAITLNVDNRDYRLLPKKGMYSNFSVGYGFVHENDIKYTKPEAVEQLNLLHGENFFEGELTISQTIPLSRNLWWTLMGNAYYKSSPSLLDNYTVGGTTTEGIRNLPFIGYREHELRMDQQLYARTDLRVGIFDNVSVSIVGNVIVGESKVFNYSDDGRDNTLTAYGVGFEFCIMLPVGPVLFDIGYNSEASAVRTDLSLGWKHFF
jgi:outer membrane protein assembly factor BamA